MGEPGEEGETIFELGDPGDVFFMIIRGTVQVRFSRVSFV